MPRLVLILGGALALQLLLALILGLGGRDFGAATQGGPLLAFDAKAVDRVRIQPAGKDPLLLERRDGAWQLPGLQGFPVSGSRLDELLGRLAGLQRRLPVATTAEAAKRFKVSAEAFERKLELLAGERVLATLWLGDAAGARRAYVRAEGDGQVFEVPLASHDLGAKADDWADPQYLHLKPEDISRLEANGLTLELAEGQWRAAGLTDGETADGEKITALVRQAARLDFLGVLGSEPGTGYGPEVPSQRLTLGLKTGDPRHYDLWKPEGQNHYVLKSSAAPYYFKLADYAVRDLVGLSRDKLVKTPAPAPAPAPAPSAQVAPSETGTGPVSESAAVGPEDTAGATDAASVGVQLPAPER